MAKYAGEDSPLLPEYELLPRRAQRPRRRCCMFLCITAILLLFVIVYAFLFVSSFSYSSKEYPPDGSGVGLSLSTHGGSVAIRNEDGSIDNVAQVRADQGYIDLLQRLSLPSSRHPTPPYNSLPESISDRPRQWRRALRKRLGYPASSDVAILVPLLQKMVNAAQAHLPPSHPALTSALVVIPNAMALYAEDVEDALEYIGLRQLTGHNIYHVPRALPAAYAGYGLGLCATPEDFEKCVEEEKTFQRRGVVIVDAGAGALATDSRGMDTPMYVYNEEYATLDWRAWARGKDETIRKNRDKIAGEVRFAIDGLRRRSSVPEGEKFVDDVLMAGEHGGDEVLLDIVREAVATYQDQEANIRDGDPRWVVARGAAELAKRVLLQRGRII